MKFILWPLATFWRLNLSSLSSKLMRYEFFKSWYKIGSSLNTFSTWLTTAQYRRRGMKLICWWNCFAILLSVRKLYWKVSAHKISPAQFCPYVSQNKFWNLCGNILISRKQIKFIAVLGIMSWNWLPVRGSCNWVFLANYRSEEWSSLLMTQFSNANTVELFFLKVTDFLKWKCVSYRIKLAFVFRHASDKNCSYFDSRSINPTKITLIIFSNWKTQLAIMRQRLFHLVENSFMVFISRKKDPIILEFATEQELHACSEKTCSWKSFRSS